MEFATKRLVRVVEWCSSHARLTAIAGVILGMAALVFTAGHFALSSDTAGLISPKLDWRQREIAFDRVFPGQGDSIVVVIDGATPELAGSAADRLASKLGEDKALFPKVEQPDGGPYFEREGLLLTSTPEEVAQTVKQLERAEPFLGPVAADPSLRGLMSSLSTMALRRAAEGRHGRRHRPPRRPARRQPDPRRAGQARILLVDRRPSPAPSPACASCAGW